MIGYIVLQQILIN